MATTYSETADSIGEKVQQRLDRLVGLKFFCRVRSNDYEYSDCSDRMTTLLEFSTLPSTDPEHPEPWFCWKVFRPISPIEYELDQFRAYDGKNVYSYDRINPLTPEHFSRSGWIKYSPGRVETYSDPINRMIDALSAREDCCFSNVVFMGSRNPDFEKWVNEHKQMRPVVQIVNSPMPDEFILESYEAGETCLSHTYRSRVVMKPEPIYMRWEWIVADSRMGSSHVDKEMEVLELASFDGVVYPSKGRFFDSNYSHGKFGRVFQYTRMYEYEVESVERVSEQRLETWVPEYPPGTSVSCPEWDQSRNIAHTRDVQIQSFLNVGLNRPGGGWLLKLLSVILYIGINIVLPFFRFAAKRYSVKNGWIIKDPKPMKGAL